MSGDPSPSGGATSGDPSVDGLVVDAEIRRGEAEVVAAFSVSPGTPTALVGPNGAGKTTLIEAVAGLVPLSRPEVSGRSTSVRIDGRILDDPVRDVFVPPEQRSVGVVFQDLRLFDHLDVLSNVAFGRRARGEARSEAESIARRWIGAVGLGGAESSRPAELSGGQAQRVALARALAADPDVLLFDEPLSSLDVRTRAEMRRLVRTHLDALNGPRLLVTHDPADAFALADQVVVLEGGRVTQTGTPAEIQRRPATSYVAARGGVNLVWGDASGGRVVVSVDGSASGAVQVHERPLELTVLDHEVAGPVRCTIPPSAIALSPSRPRGSQRNVWVATVRSVEPMGDRVRIVLDGPVGLAAAVTPGAVAALSLGPGVEVWAAVKATEIDVQPV